VLTNKEGQEQASRARADPHRPIIMQRDRDTKAHDRQWLGLLQLPLTRCIAYRLMQKSKRLTEGIGTKKILIQESIVESARK
jgi:hypothetical protein